MARQSVIYQPAPAQLPTPEPELPQPHSSDSKDHLLSCTTSSDTDSDSDPFAPHSQPCTRHSSVLHTSLPSPFNALSAPTRRRTTAPRRPETPRTRNGTPHPTVKSLPSSKLRQSTLPPQDDLPLVLLHVTLLPLPSGLNSSHAEVLDEGTKQRLALLKMKLVGEVAKRGLLIKHPRADYELLEERILQALELEEGRVTVDGHYIPLHDDEDGEAREEEDRVDSGAEVEEEEGDKCETCCRKVRGAGHGVGGGKKWEVQIFAGNGRMRAETWGVAWREMEVVDVLVVPWMGEEEKLRVEAAGQERVRTADGNTEEQTEGEDDGEKGSKVDEEEALRRQIQDEEQLRRDQHEALMLEKIMALEAKIYDLNSNPEQEKRRIPRRRSSDYSELPPAFKPEQVPVEVLLRNYLKVMAKDVRNIIITILLAVVVVLGIRVTAVRSANQLERFDSCRAMGETIAGSLAKLQHHASVASTSITPQPIVSVFKKDSVPLQTMDGKTDAMIDESIVVELAGESMNTGEGELELKKQSDEPIKPAIHVEEIIETTRDISQADTVHSEADIDGRYYLRDLVVIHDDM
ncbi:Hypothetical protein D9617_16g015630 [Elsinoe fawcettii]|nr:Hypothetical protein D9617_16g015630 [Elsinoe fawcettii]